MRQDDNVYNTQFNLLTYLNKVDCISKDNVRDSREKE